MFRFMKRFGRDSQARGRGTGPINRAQQMQPTTELRGPGEPEVALGVDYFYIVNEGRGKVLDDPGGSTSNGQYIDQWQLTGTANQQWDIVNEGGGNFKIVNGASGMCLDNSLSTSNGPYIDQSQGNSNPSQLWPPPLQPNNSSVITNVYSSKNLADPLSSQSNGTRMVQYQSTGGAEQQWTLLQAANAPAFTYYVQNASSADPVRGAGVLDRKR